MLRALQRLMRLNTVVLQNGEKGIHFLDNWKNTKTCHY